MTGTSHEPEGRPASGATFPGDASRAALPSPAGWSTRWSAYRPSGCSRLVYAGDGRFSYEEDVYNMAHVLEDLSSSGWSPRGGTMSLPPERPNRDFSLPG